MSDITGVCDLIESETTFARDGRFGGPWVIEWVVGRNAASFRVQVFLPEGERPNTATHPLVALMREAMEADRPVTLVLGIA